MSNRLETFIAGMTRLVDADLPEAALVAQARPLLAELIAHDDWLPDRLAVPGHDTYRQYLLHCDPRERFSVLSFVWKPGQSTPVHDHTVWGLVGVMRGAELCEEFNGAAAGKPFHASGKHRIEPGEIDRLSPTVGDIHVVSNAGQETAVSIHVYGANIGAVRRHVYDPATGEAKEFVSGYHNRTLPNLWDRSGPG